MRLPSPDSRRTPRHRLRSWAGVAVLGLGLATGCRHGAATERPLDARAQAREYLEKKQPERALPLLEAESARAPEDLELARMLTEAQVKAGRTDTWIAELQRRNAQVERAENHYMLGLAYFSRASDAGGPAVAAFERAVELKPAEPELHYRLGLARLESEQYAAAVGPLRRAAELAPERAGVRLPLAKALHRTGDSAGAVAALGALVRMSPSRAEVATARALMDQIADPFARSGQVLEELVPSIRKTADLVQEVVAASAEQTSGVTQMNKAMQHVDQVTQRNASASEELASTAEEMSAQAEALQQRVSFFRVHEGFGRDGRPVYRPTPPAPSAGRLPSAGHALKAAASGPTPGAPRASVPAPLLDEDREFKRF